MALPKAMLCILGNQPGVGAPEEVLLRAAGFATATIRWEEVAAQQRGWMQLMPILNDASLQAWVFAGRPADITEELLSQVSMLTLGMSRPTPPVTAFVLLGSGEEPAFPDLLDHVRVFHGNASFAPRLAAARLKPMCMLPRPFHIRAHVDPFIGQWLEIGPLENETWDGFMAGVVDAEVTAFGIGLRGNLPQKSVLHHPQSGIKGEWGDLRFSACAAKNSMTSDMACYMRVEGCPRIVFITGYQDENRAQEMEKGIRHLDLF